jgi:acetolactate synthase-1/2/3 large subunit
MLVLGGRAPAMRWGQGSLQEIDHVPFVAPLTKFAATPERPPRSRARRRGDRRRARAATGPTFVDFPLDHVFMEGAPRRRRPPPDPRAPAGGAGARSSARPSCSRGAERPVIMAGTDLYWGHGEDALRALAEELRHPGLPQRPGPRLPARRPRALLLARARHGAEGRRRRARRSACRWTSASASAARSARTPRSSSIDSRRAGARPHPRSRRGELYGGHRATLDGAARGGGGRRPATGHGDWVADLRARRRTRSAPPSRPSATTTARRCTRCASTSELGEVLDRDAIVIGDGGDFVSYAGRVIDSYEPGCWMDPGPYGCLGAGPGYALAPSSRTPSARSCLLLGDGAFGFAGMEFDTLVRHGVPSSA